jgi:hypothetical protein
MPFILLALGARGRKFPACLPSVGKPAGRESGLPYKKASIATGFFYEFS